MYTHPQRVKTGGLSWSSVFGGKKAEELAFVSFVQAYDDGHETTWEATLVKPTKAATSPHNALTGKAGGAVYALDGKWSGGCEGSFTADKLEEGLVDLDPAREHADGSLAGVEVRACKL